MNIDYLKKILTARVYDVATETPLELAPALSQRLNNQIYFKREDMQSVFSFKIRGAYNKMAQLSEADRKRGVICASAGNHAQGVAWASHRLGVQAITVMPHGAPATKIAGVQHWGATVRQHGNSYDEAFAFARELAEQNGYRFLSAFDDPDVIAGQGTLGIELAPHAPDVVIVPIGGGGLASGVALALKSQGVRIIGAQVEGVDSMARAIKGDVREIDPVPTLADGVKVKIP
ncbi:MAG: pyridoxal-phosphate dependent enzyme, partial [Janthinobacterium sp.]